MNNEPEIISFESNSNTDVLATSSAVTKAFSVIDAYAEDLTAKNYVTNPAIARESEIKKMIIVLLTPEKSALLVGHAGIGKTAIVEGLADLIQIEEIQN